jgi:two-component system NtrC family sensor kinase
MRLRTRLMLLIGAASLIPLAVLGIGATDVSVGRLTQKATDSQARLADQMASEIDLWISFQLTQIAEQVDAFQVAKLSDKKLKGFQKLVFQQMKDVHIVGIVTAEGAELAPTLLLTEKGTGRLVNKDAVSDERFSAFKSALPTERMAEEQRRWASDLGAAQPRPVVVGRPYLPPGRRIPVLPVAVPASPQRSMFLVVELSLDRIEARFNRAAEDGLDVALLDAGGSSALSRGAGLIEADHFKIFQPDSACAEVRYTAEADVSVLAACAPVGGTGWLMVVAEPMDVITRAGDEIRNRTGFISVFAAVLSGLFGMLFSVGVAQRITRIRDAALAVAEGDLGRTVSLEGAREVRDLSRAFNFMSRRLSANRDRLAVQQAEISVFNAVLKRQLAEQAVDLNEAHRLLLQSSRLVAVGEMGAGLAHELNNPLAGILGLVQVLQMRAGGSDDQLLEIEHQAQRCSEIVAQLTRYARGVQQGSIPPDRGRADLSTMLDDVVTVVTAPFSAIGVSVHQVAPTGLAMRGDADALSGALLQLVNSLQAGCRAGGALELNGGLAGDMVEVVLSLTGTNFDTESDDWRAAGMGLWMARGVISQHGGRLIEPDDLGARVLRWTVRIPVGD